METKEINKEMDKVKSDIANLREDMAELLKAVKTSGVEQGKEFYEEAYDRARRTGDSVREKASHAYGALEREVEEYPLMSLLAAFATGFVAGMIMDRRR